MMVSDIILLEELPNSVQSSIEAYVGCVAGASLKQSYLEMIAAAGFQDIEILDEVPFVTAANPDDPLLKSVLSHLDLTSEELLRLARAVVSAKIGATKPPLKN